MQADPLVAHVPGTGVTGPKVQPTDMVTQPASMPEDLSGREYDSICSQITLQVRLILCVVHRYVSQVVAVGIWANTFMSDDIANVL